MCSLNYVLRKYIHYVSLSKMHHTSIDASKREGEGGISDSETVVIESGFFRDVASEVAYKVVSLVTVCLAKDEDRDLAACSIHACNMASLAEVDAVSSHVVGALAA